MQYGKNYGPETLFTEYKEFTFHHSGVDFDLNTAEELVINSKWCFNDMIYEAIEKYFKIYIAKYATSFLNEDSEADYGNLYIGIADDGTIQGIPFQGQLDIKILKELLIKYIKKNMYSENMEEVYDSISFELIDIKYERMHIEKYNTLYDQYLYVKEQIKKNEEEFKKIMESWNEVHDRYTQKLVNLFNQEPTRQEILNYIITIEPSSRVINMIKSGYILAFKTHEEINEVKNDIDSPYYWVCKFKDEYLDNIRKSRPIQWFKSAIASFLNPVYIIMKINNMIPWWMQNNLNMNLYLIKIHFKKIDGINDIYYIDHLGKYHRCYRSLYNGKPYCRKN